MSRYGFAALGALASACGLAVVAGGAVSAAPAMAASASPVARAPRAAAFAGSAAKAPVPVTAANTSQQINCQDTPPDIQANIARVTTPPWAQNALDFSQAWFLSKGQGVTVAVIDSGVNWNLQLNGRVSAIDETGTGITDCVGHGTAVAGIIAASDEPVTTAFSGVAPDANILSVKVANADQGSADNPHVGNSDTLAQGITDAVNDGASVLSISIVSPSTTKLQTAVQYAESRNVVVVAAGGNDFQGGPKGPFYPASYPGVLSVGALDSTGALASFADPNTQESVTAPGVNVTSIEPEGYANNLVGTSFATPFVSGVAALVRSRYPTMSAAQVVARIEATADGPTASLTGNGMVNPLQAVQAVLPLGANPNASSAAGNLQPVPVSRPVPPDPGTMDAVMATTAGAIAAAALVAIGAAVISQGRRRRHNPRAAQPPDPNVPADTGLSDRPIWE